MDNQDVTRKALGAFNLTQSDNDHKALRGLRTAQTLVKKHMATDLLSFFKTLASEVDEDGLSLEDWKEIAESQGNDIERLEAENTKLQRGLQKARAEADRLRSETRLIRSQAPAASGVLTYKEKLERWCQKSVVIDENCWVGTKDIQATFERKHPGLRKYGITLNRFSRIFREITGEIAILGGPLGKNKGFPIRYEK